MPTLRIILFEAHDTALLSLALDIRTKVFIEGQQVPAELEHDGLEEEATHYLVYLDEVPIGTARWRLTEKGIKLERFAVLDSYRNKGVGDWLLKKILEDVMPKGQKIYLHAQADAMNLYLRNGFKIASAPFHEAGILHYLMTL